MQGASRALGRGGIKVRLGSCNGRTLGPEGRSLDDSRFPAEQEGGTFLFSLVILPAQKKAEEEGGRAESGFVFHHIDIT